MQNDDNVRVTGNRENPAVITLDRGGGCSQNKVRAHKHASGNPADVDHAATRAAGAGFRSARCRHERGQPRQLPQPP
ncbi:hypothetical protein D3C83_42570 [compost metagenome]